MTDMTDAVNEMADDAGMEDVDAVEPDEPFEANVSDEFTVLKQQFIAALVAERARYEELLTNFHHWVADELTTVATVMNEWGQYMGDMIEANAAVAEPMPKMSRDDVLRVAVEAGIKPSELARAIAERPDGQ